MTTSLLTRSLGATLGATLLLACGDDAETTASAGNTEATTNFTNPSSSSTSEGPEPTGGQTTGIGGSMTESASGTSTTDATTDATTAGPTTDPSTSSTDPDTTEPPPGSSSSGEPDTSSTGDPDTSTTGDPDTTDGETGNPLDCPLVAQHTPCDDASDDPLHAMGLNCTSLGGDFANNVNAITVANLDFQAPPPIDGMKAWEVAAAYGTFVDPNTQKPFWSPREGEKVLLISSGLLPPPDGQGTITIPDGLVYNDSFPSFFFDDPPFDDNVMPPVMSAQNGSPDPMGYTNCDGVNDCSNTLLDQWNLGNENAEDKMWFTFELTAPALANGDMVDAKGYTFDFAYFSAEFPEYVDSGYNDIFVVWQDSEDYTGNVTFINGQPLTVTALWPIDYMSGDQHLTGTGHINDGGATGWYKATGGIKPGETFTLSFGVFDMGDSSFDTTAIIDNFQWDCEGCIPNEVMSCGIDPQ